MCHSENDRARLKFWATTFDAHSLRYFIDNDDAAMGAVERLGDTVDFEMDAPSRVHGEVGSSVAMPSTKESDIQTKARKMAQTMGKTMKEWMVKEEEQWKRYQRQEEERRTKERKRQWNNHQALVSSILNAIRTPPPTVPTESSPPSPRVVHRSSLVTSPRALHRIPNVLGESGASRSMEIWRTFNQSAPTGSTYVDDEYASGPLSLEQLHAQWRRMRPLVGPNEGDALITAIDIVVDRVRDGQDPVPRRVAKVLADGYELLAGPEWMQVHADVLRGIYLYTALDASERGMQTLSLKHVLLALLHVNDVPLPLRKWYRMPQNAEIRCRSVGQGVCVRWKTQTTLFSEKPNRVGNVKHHRLSLFNPGALIREHCGLCVSRLSFCVIPHKKKLHLTPKIPIPIKITPLVSFVMYFFRS